VKFENGVGYGEMRTNYNPDVPCTLEPGHEATWMAPLDDLRRLVYGQGLKRQGAHMEIKLGTGKVARTRQRVIIRASESAGDR